MSKLTKKFFLNFLLSNLDDVEVTAPANKAQLRYDSATQKWVATKELGVIQRVINGGLFVAATDIAIGHELEIENGAVEIEGALVLE